jgi:CrcB protein
MSLLVVLGVGVLGGVGSVLRFLLDSAVTVRVGRGFPYGTLVVNVLGSLLLGVFVGAALSTDAYRIAAIGLVGAFTTFSTWAFESHRLGEDGQLRLGTTNFVVSLVLGVAAAWAGRRVGTAL